MNTNNTYGSIVAYKLSDFDMSRDVIETSFHSAGIEEVYVPNERMPRKAFQKALKDSIGGEDGFMIRPVLKKGAKMSSGLVQEQKDADNQDLKYNVANVLTLNSDSETISGKTGFRTDAVVESYKMYKGQLGALEISFKVKELLFNSMAIHMLCDKVIFVPYKYQENVDKIVRLFSNLKEAKAPVEIEVVGVDKGSTTRNTIVKQFATQTIRMLQKEIDFCKSQRNKFETGALKFLRPQAFRKQLGKIEVLDERIRTYITLLDLTPDEDRVILEKLEEVDTEISKNMELAQSSTSKKRNRQSVIELRNSQ
jgi:hypothetical protein